MTGCGVKGCSTSVVPRGVRSQSAVRTEGKRSGSVVRCFSDAVSVQPTARMEEGWLKTGAAGEMTGESATATVRGTDGGALGKKLETAADIK